MSIYKNLDSEGIKFLILTQSELYFYRDSVGFGMVIIGIDIVNKIENVN